MISVEIVASGQSVRIFSHLLMKFSFVYPRFIALSKSVEPLCKGTCICLHIFGLEANS